MATTHALSDLEAKAASRTAFTRADADRVVACPDLVSVGTLGAAGVGAAYGLFPLGWIILNTIFLYQLAVDSGTFETVKRSLASLSGDRRIQLVLVAFSFGAFFEGAAGVGDVDEGEARRLAGDSPPRLGERDAFDAGAADEALATRASQLRLR